MPTTDPADDALRQALEIYQRIGAAGATRLAAEINSPIKQPATIASRLTRRSGVLPPYESVTAGDQARSLVAGPRALERPVR
jgi:hypothetical protein